MSVTYANFKHWVTGKQAIMIVGSDGRISTAPTENTEIPEGAIDLGGKTMMPKFIDAHCHILPTGLDMQKLNLSSCGSKSEVLDAVRDEAAQSDREWILAVQYDQNKFADGQNITRQELDAISETRPILLRHYNGHCSVANTEVFRQLQIDANTPDPSGGIYERDASGELTGFVTESAHDRIWAGTPAPTLEDMIAGIDAAAQSMASMNIGCASDMMTGRFDLEKEL
ncbi:MAG TPA: amidohydrolase family protein, partial [Fimbriimonas sp.]|nr:amidohydrolase family protein [Fimbriimonas sp.]